MNGSQGGSDVEVIVGVTDGMLVPVGGGNVAVGMVLVFTRTTGVSITPVVVQATRINNKRKLSIDLIRTDQSSQPERV